MVSRWRLRTGLTGGKKLILVESREKESSEEKKK